MRGAEGVSEHDFCKSKRAAFFSLLPVLGFFLPPFDISFNPCKDEYTQLACVSLGGTSYAEAFYFSVDGIHKSRSPVIDVSKGRCQPRKVDL